MLSDAGEDPCPILVLCLKVHSVQSIPRNPSVGTLSNAAIQAIASVR